MFQSFLLAFGQEMKSPEPKKRNDKCDEINSDSNGDKTVFELEDEIEIKFDGEETGDIQGIDKCVEINSYTSEEKGTLGLEDKIGFFDNKESVQTHRNENSYSKLDGQDIKCLQPKKRNEKCDEINNDTTGDKPVFELEDEIVIKLDDKETRDNQGIDKWVEINRNLKSYSELESYDYINHDKKIITLDDENKVDASKSIDKNLNLEIFEKWMVKIFPNKLSFWKLSNYSDDDNISNEATYARLTIISIFITVVLCFITFGQLIWILDLSRGPIVVQPFIPKGNNPFCK